MARLVEKRKSIARVSHMLSFFGVLAAANAAHGASAPVIPEDTHKLPAYQSAVMPSITTCDVKSGQDEVSSPIGPTGNAVVDFATSAATTVFKGVKGGSKKPVDTGDDMGDDTGGIKAGVGFADAGKCGSVKDLNDDKDLAKDVACSDATNPKYIADITEKNNEAKGILACQRGVLAAIKGEFSCFAKQLTGAQSYLGQVLSSPGGLNAVLQGGVKTLHDLADETSDRQGQLADIDKRLNDPKNGMNAARDALDKLNVAIPTAEASFENKNRDIDTVTQQMMMAKTMECLNTTQTGWPSCIKSGTSSSKYKSNPSPIEYLQCIYAQQANVLTSNGIVKNATAEQARIDEVNGVFGKDGKPGSLDVPQAGKVPLFNNSTGAITGDIISYNVLTVDQLLAQIAPLLASVSSATAGKPAYAKLVSAFKTQVQTCYDKSAVATRTAVENFQSTVRSGNASQMRALASQYEQAIKAATGKSVQLSTTACEKAPLSGQVQCLKGMNGLATAILTGEDPSSNLSGVAATLTNGQPPIRGFKSILTATNVPARGLVVDCSMGGGLKNCIAQYESYQTGLTKVVADLTKRKETLTNDVNQRIESVAQCVASGGMGSCQGTGVPPNQGMNLNALSSNLSAAKERIVKAMGDLGIADSLDLKNVEVGSTDKDPTTGLYSSSALKNLLLKSVTPPLLANDASAFKSAKDEIGTKDKELAKSQKGLTDYLTALNARKSECDTSGKNKRCENVKDFQKAFCDSSTDGVAASIKSWEDISNAAGLSGKFDVATSAQKKADELRNKKLLGTQPTGEMNTNSVSATTSLTCGTAPQEYSDACLGLGSMLSPNVQKDGQGTGKRKGQGQATSEAH